MSEKQFGPQPLRPLSDSRPLWKEENIIRARVEAVKWVVGLIVLGYLVWSILPKE